MKIKFLVLIIVVTVFLGTATTGIIVSNNPKIVFAKSVTNLIEDLTERQELELIENVISNGSICISIKDNDEEDNKLLPFHKINGKMYFSKNAFMMENFEFRAPYNGTSFNLYSSSEEVYIENEEVLQGTYGINYDDFEKNLSNSIFAPNSNSDYSLDEEDYNDALELISTAKNYKKLIKDFEKLSKDVLKDIWGIAKEDFEFTNEVDKITIDENEIKVRQTSLIIEAESLSNFIERVYQYLYSDKKIVDFLTKYESFICDVLRERYILEDYEEFLNEFGTRLSEIKENINNNFEKTIISFYNKNMSKNIVKFDIKTNDKEFIDIEFGVKGVKRTEKIFVIYDDAQITYSIKTNSVTEFDASIECYENNSHWVYMDTFNLNVNKKENVFSALYEDTIILGGKTEVTKKYTINGDFVKDRNSFGLSFDSVDYNYCEKYSDSRSFSADKKYNVVGSLIISVKDNMPKPINNYKTIDEFTEEDVEKLNNFID